MAKRKVTQPFTQLNQVSLFSDNDLTNMLHTKVIECVRLKELSQGDRFTFRDTMTDIQITEIQFVSAIDTYIFNGSVMQNRPVVVSATTGKTYILFPTDIWERGVLVVKNKPKNNCL